MSDKQMLSTAYAVAARSPHGTQNGATLVNEGFLIGQGYNHPVCQIETVAHDFAYEHAERHAIYSAASQGHQTLGTTMFCPWAACPDCARAIILAGIHKVVVHKQRMALTPSRWAMRVNVGLLILADAGVKVVEFSGRVKAPAIRVNGELWEP